MAEDLNALLMNVEPLTEGDPRYSELLSDVQANILTGHGRREARYYFLRFKDLIQAKYLCGMLPRSAAERAEAFVPKNDETWLALSPPQAPKGKQIGNSSWLLSKDEYQRIQHLQLTSEKAARKPNRTTTRGGAGGGQQGSAQDFAVNLMLTHRGYAKLTEGPLPSDLPFREGMARRKALLNDVEPSNDEASPGWETELGAADALLIVAYNPCAKQEDKKRQQAALGSLEAVLERGGMLMSRQIGKLLSVALGEISPHVAPNARKKQVAIEPFGFRDGISQPAFYAADIRELERRGIVGASDASAQDGVSSARARAAAFAPLDLALCPDVNGKTPHACGSYFVFRKLGQNIEKFYAQAATIAETTKRAEEDILAELVGRRRDGSPLAGASGAGSNTFDYLDDDEGVRCPFHAHVRKVNPRGDAPTLARKERIVRHGIPYGPAIERDRTGKPILKQGKVTREGAEQAGIKRNEIGLLFLCAQSNIEKQFERIQRDWANNALFPWGKLPGADTIAGQRPPGEMNNIRVQTQKPVESDVQFTYDPVVNFRGGDYFFAPSISFLKSLQDGLKK